MKWRQSSQVFQISAIKGRRGRRQHLEGPELLSLLMKLAENGAWLIIDRSSPVQREKLKTQGKEAHSF